MLEKPAGLVRARGAMQERQRSTGHVRDDPLRHLFEISSEIELRDAQLWIDQTVWMGYADARDERPISERR